MIETTVLTSRTDTGTPDVTIDADGDLQIYPTGTDGGTALFMSPADWDVLVAAVVVARGVQKPTPGLLGLASAVNEAAIAYRETLDSDVTGYDEVFTAGRILLTAVDKLTGAVVEAENDAPTPSSQYGSGWRDGWNEAVKAAHVLTGNDDVSRLRSATALTDFPDTDEQDAADARIVAHEQYLASEGADHLYEGRGE